MSAGTLRIATRASQLALWQTRHVADLLTAQNPRLVIELLPITTEGDRILDRPLARIGGKGLFIKELEVALLEDRADIAVHSMKDVPAELPDELHIAAILEREDPADVLVSATGVTLAELPAGSRVGTSSLRRRSQLLERRPDLAIADLRGNVPTRLGRLASGQYDAIVLAAAGLVRLGLLSGQCRRLGIDEVLPAVGQGAIGIECRRDDGRVNALVALLADADTADCVGAERAMNAMLGGSCQVPIAGHARIRDGELVLNGLVASVDGSEMVRQTARGPRGEATRIGRELGQALLAAGAADILRQLNET